MTSIPTLSDHDIRGKRVLIREDLNVPIEDGQIVSDARIQAALPSIKLAVEAGARVMIAAHLGRPKEGVPIAEQPEASLAPVAARIAELTGYKVRLVTDYLDGFEPDDEDLVLLENIRINAGEKANDPVLAGKLASLCDIFVMDAFGTAHRAQASTEGVIHQAAAACAGPLLAAELEALGLALANPARPMMAIVGGSKVSTKLEVLNSLASKVDRLVVGGGMANTFLAATGLEVGRSLYEPDMIGTARALLDKVEIPLPVDLVVAQQGAADLAPANDFVKAAELAADKAIVKAANQVAADELILDIGPQSAEHLCNLVSKSSTILWNGPVGVAEIPAFAQSTHALARAIAASSAYSLAGGGDTLAVIDALGISEQISYISTGGGAFLEFVEGKQLPAVAALEARS